LPRFIIERFTYYIYIERINSTIGTLAVPSVMLLAVLLISNFNWLSLSVHASEIEIYSFYMMKVSYIISSLKFEIMCPYFPFLYNCFRKGTKVPCAGHFCAITKHFYHYRFFFKWNTQKPFTLHLFARNADKHRGSETERLILTLHHPSCFCYFQISTDRQSLVHASI